MKILTFLLAALIFIMCLPGYILGFLFWPSAIAFMEAKSTLEDFGHHVAQDASKRAARSDVHFNDSHN